MTKEQLEKATELKVSLDVIDVLWGIVCYPYPQLYCDNKKMIKEINKHTGFCYDRESVSFVHLDEKTRDELKEAIQHVLSERRKEIEEEFKNL